MGIFTPISQALAATGRPSLFKQINELYARDHKLIAELLSIEWLAGEIAERSSFTFEEAKYLLAGISVSEPAHLRTPKGMACASILLGVRGGPIAPTRH